MPAALGGPLAAPLNAVLPAADPSPHSLFAETQQFFNKQRQVDLKRTDSIRGISLMYQQTVSIMPLLVTCRSRSWTPCAFSHRSAIAKLRGDNLLLKEEVLLENKFSVQPTSASASALIQHLQDQSDLYSDKVILMANLGS